MHRTGGEPGGGEVQGPPTPESVAATGLSGEFILDLLLKVLYVQGARTGHHLTDVVRLPFSFVDDQLLSLQQRRLVEVRTTSGPSRGGYTFELTGPGRDRAREALASSQYVGPAPVPLRAVPRVGRAAEHPQRARDGGGHPDGVPADGALRRDPRRARSRHQLGEVAVPLRRARATARP